VLALLALDRKRPFARCQCTTCDGKVLNLVAVLRVPGCIKAKLLGLAREGGVALDNDECVYSVVKLFEAQLEHLELDAKDDHIVHLGSLCWRVWRPAVAGACGCVVGWKRPRRVMPNLIVWDGVVELVPERPGTVAERIAESAIAAEQIND
jgi:hypothetical protein